MRIESAFIDGYGVFHDQAIDGMGGGIVLFTGMNEAGKSTLRHFFVDMLFGARRRVAPPHPPLRGGAHGGLLRITMSNGETRTLERSFAGPARHNPCVELGGMSRELYSNVFAFGLPELVSFEGLAGDEAASRIFSAGAGLGASSYARARQQLATAMDALGTRSSRNRPLNVACEKLGAAVGHVEQVARQQGRYSALVRDIDAKQAERDRLAEDEARLDDAAAELGQLDRTRGLWESMEAARSELEAMRASEVPAHAAVLAIADRIDALGASLDRWLGQVQEAVRAQATLDAVSARRRELMLKLGPDWTEARIEAFDTSIEARQRVRRHGERIAEAEAGLGLAQANVEAALRAVHDCAQARGDIAAEMERYGSGPLPDEASVRARLASVTAARSALADLAAARARQEAEFGRLEGRVQLEEWAAAARRQAAGPGGVRGNLAPALLSLLSVVAAALAVPLADASAGAGPALGAVAIVFAIGAIALLRARAGRLRVALVAEREATLSRQAAADAHAASSEAVTAARGALDECLANLGIAPAPGSPGASLIYALDAAEEQAREDAAALRDVVGLRIRLKRADDNMEEAQGRLDQRRLELKDAGRARGVAASDWVAWLSGAGLLASEKADFVLDVFDAVGAVRASMAEAASASELLVRAKAEVQSYLNEVVLACEALGRHADAEAGRVPQLVASLTDELAQARAARDRLEAASERLTSLSTGFAASYPEALRGAALTRHREMTAERVRLALAEVRSELAEAREAMQRLAGEHALLIQEKQGMEGADALLLAQVEAESARKELAAVVRSWARLAVARRLMDAAVESYETQRQPAVMREASDALGLITAGRWTRVVARVAELAKIDVEDARGARQSTEELSYGTQQQLYLAVRCGLVREYTRRGEPLPVILDDVLVNFDPDRAAAAAIALSDLGDLCQVLVFTCHPQMAEAFISTGKVSARFELAGGKICAL